MIYFDNAATTKIDNDALEIYNKISNECFFNCSSLHKGGVLAHNELEKARQTILKTLNASFGDKLIICSGATEANNMAFLGLTRKNFKILTSIGEHPSVYNLSKINNLDIDCVDLDSSGKVDVQKFEEMLKTTKYDFVSIMYVNNETGAVNDIAMLCELAKRYNPKCIFHSDCVQAYGKIDIHVDNLGIDSLSISAHKINGPKGVGALYVRSGVKFNAINYGGGQESGHRSGTENLPAIASFAYIAKNKCDNIELNHQKVLDVKSRILSHLKQSGIDFRLNGDESCSPYILSLSFSGIKGEVLLHMLEMDEIYVGTGSACSSKSADNRILKAMGDSKDEIYGNIRLSFSSDNTIEQANIVVQKIVDYVTNLRQIKG